MVTERSRQASRADTSAPWARPTGRPRGVFARACAPSRATMFAYALSGANVRARVQAGQALAAHAPRAPGRVVRQALRSWVPVGVWVDAGVCASLACACPAVASCVYMHSLAAARLPRGRLQCQCCARASVGRLARACVARRSLASRLVCRCRVVSAAALRAANAAAGAAAAAAHPAAAAAAANATTVGASAAAAGSQFSSEHFPLERNYHWPWSDIYL